MVSFPALATTVGATVTSIVSLTGLGQPNVSVTFKIYAVVFEGPAIGLVVFALSRELTGDQLKEDPITVLRNWIRLPKHITVSFPNRAVGYGISVTPEVSLSSQCPRLAFT